MLGLWWSLNVAKETVPPDSEFQYKEMGGMFSRRTNQVAQAMEMSWEGALGPD